MCGSVPTLRAESDLFPGMTRETDRNLPPLPPFERQRNEAERVCEVCGQRFDTRDQDQVFHHVAEMHKPLPIR
jgi:hypothetical protein